MLLSSLIGLFGGHEGIVLDPHIRDWVLLPILVVKFMDGLVRHFISILLTSKARASKEATTKKEKIFKAPAPTSDSEDGAPPMPQMPAQDPFVMMDMMKRNLGMFVPNIVFFGWVSYFFAGFVIMRLPFGLTDAFKGMFQRGIGLKSLDVRYVSSLSWFFICMFGLRSVFSVLLGAGNNTDETKIMRQQMTGGGMPQDMTKLFASERTELEIANHRFAVADCEERLIAAMH